MKCIDCGKASGDYIYKGNSLCEWCFELARLLEILENNKIVEEELLEQTNEKIAKCKYWIKVEREKNDFHNPEVI